MMPGLKSMLSYATRYDKIVLAVCALLSVSSMFAPLLKSEGSKVRIEIDGMLQYEGELFAKKQLTFDGKTGPIVIETDSLGVDHRRCCGFFIASRDSHVGRENERAGQ